MFQRLHNSPTALMSIILGQETILPISEPDDSTPTFTEKELSFYDGTKDPKVRTPGISAPRNPPGPPPHEDPHEGSYQSSL